MSCDKSCEYPEKITFWFMLFHPRRALRLLRRGSEETLLLAQTREQLTQAHSATKQQQSAAEIAAQERDDLRRRLNETLLTVETLSKSVLTLRHDLDEYRDTDRRLDEFMGRLEAAENMKADYEARLRKAHARIDNLSAALSQYETCELDDPAPIRMTPPSTNHPTTPPNTRPKTTPRPDGRPKTLPNTPPNNDTSADDSDWLMTLS